MRNLIPSIVLMCGLSASAQNNYVNVQASFDPNKLFHIVDNERTVVDHKGLDFDVEVGASEGKFYGYIFYGSFRNAQYQNYGTGADWTLFLNHNFEVKAGAALSIVLREQQFGTNLKHTGWGSTFGYQFRGVGALRLNDNLSTVFVPAWHHRGDLRSGIFELSIGISYKFYRK